MGTGVSSQETLVVQLHVLLCRACARHVCEIISRRVKPKDIMAFPFLCKGCPPLHFAYLTCTSLTPNTSTMVTFSSFAPVSKNTLFRIYYYSTHVYRCASPLAKKNNLRFLISLAYTQSQYVLIQVPINQEADKKFRLKRKKRKKSESGRRKFGSIDNTSLRMKNRKRQQTKTPAMGIF